MDSADDKPGDPRHASMLSPKWAALFLLGGGAVLLVLGVLVRLLLGLSAASDRVFALEALISGLVVIWFIHFQFGLKPVLTSKLRIPFLYVWLLLCAYVFFLRPFEQGS